MKAKTTIALTAEEIEIVKYAVNNYALELMQKSTTWATGSGEEDYYHRKAYQVNDIWVRFFAAGERLEKKTATSAE